MEKRKVILVDKESFLRDAFKNTLLSIGNVEIIAEASNGNDFLSLLKTHKPDIIFIDIKIPGIDGIEATKIAIKSYPKLSIFGFSSNDRQCYIEEMIKAGAKGYLSKCHDNYDLLNEIIKDPNKRNFFSAKIDFNAKIAS